MKKGLLLSVVASTMIFAGGDIAPVEPAAPASADFWGQIGFSYDANDVDGGFGFGDKENNSFSATVVLGVEKEIGYGFGVGFELAGWTDFGWDIAANPRVATDTGDRSSAEVSQAYLTYTFGNTAIKAGRQALPVAVSPWAWSDRTAGVIDTAFDAVVIANTDLQDTTLVGAWVASAVAQDDVYHLGADDLGIFMLAAINKSLANTTVTVSAYYFPDALVKDKDIWSVWASAVGSFDGVNWGLQAAVVDGDYAGDATYGVAAKVGSSWGDFDATLVASYINDGAYSLNLSGTSGFWGNSLGGFLDNGKGANGDTTTQVRVDWGYKLGTGKLFGGVGYVAYGDANAAGLDTGFGARLGYKFNVMGVDAKVEYRYATYDLIGGGDLTKQRVRVEAFYKF